MAVKVGQNVRSKISGFSGKVTERIQIEHGHQVVTPPPGAAPLEAGGHEGGEYEPRVDLRVEYVDGNGNTAEVLINEADAEVI